MHSTLRYILLGGLSVLVGYLLWHERQVAEEQSRQRSEQQAQARAEAQELEQMLKRERSEHAELEALREQLKQQTRVSGAAPERK